MIRRLPQFLALAFVSLAICAGCSNSKTDPGKVVVKGKLLDNGKPLTLEPTKANLPKGAHGLPPGTAGAAILQIVFISVESKEQTPAQTNLETMTFEAQIKPGQYKIAVTAKFGFAPDTPDYFKGMYTPDKTQILRDIKGGEEILLDLTKPQG
ncbi:MAG: hypothetical protein C0467_01130 [Planctomycetaceae bacterium]|nr:hypothetical protein [Planctomycetaceae bacterium]